MPVPRRPDPPEEGPERPPDEKERALRAAAAARIAQQQTWVDLQLRRAMERGDFEGLSGFGKPIEGLGERHDPDWWVKQLIEREQITGVVPPSLQLRREDAELDDRLDRLGSEAEVRREVGEFNARVRWALYRPPEGPPLITAQRDPDTEVTRWAERPRQRAVQRAAQREVPRTPRRRRWLTRRPRND
jgi:hypothetical protein